MKKLMLILCLILYGAAYAQPQLSGNLSGTVGPGTYLVVGDIQVPSGQTLTIEPGTTFLHNGHWYWRIYGTVNAVGAVGDSIKWLRQDPVDSHRFAGIRFLPGAPAGSILSHCVVEWGYSPNSAASTEMGGCIQAYTVPITVTHSRISYGYAWWGGGGIAGNNTDGLVITENLICDNSDYQWIGGGILLENCTNATISNNVICRNASTGT